MIEPTRQASNDTADYDDTASSDARVGRTVPIAACITTMHRPETLAICLAALSRCHPAPAQIVVSDDSTLPAMIKANRALVEHYPDVVYVPGPQRGVCANRNHALASLTRGPQRQPQFVSFIDDDLLLPTGFFGTADAFYASLTPAAQRLTIATGGLDDLALGPVSLTFRGYFRRTAKPGSATAAAVFPITLFDTVLWDENIYFGSEDAELCLRATAAKFEIVFLETLTYTHLAVDAGVLTQQQAGKLSRYELCCEAARLYIGTKRYWSIEPNPIKLFLFLSIYFLHMTFYLTRRHSLRSLGQLIRLSNLQRVWTPDA